MSIAGTYTHTHTVNPEEFLKLVCKNIFLKNCKQIRFNNSLDKHLSKENIIGYTTTISTLTRSVRDDVYTLSATIGPFWGRKIKFRIGVPFIEGDGEVIVCCRFLIKVLPFNVQIRFRQSLNVTTTYFC